MRPQLFELLVCPECRVSLTCTPTSTGADGDIVEGLLHCGACGASYPVARGIPRFVPSENYAMSFGYQWNRFRSEQIDSLNGIGQSERRLSTETGWEPRWMAGKCVLDAGCGAGRFLEVASRTSTAEVIGVDISSAVDAARETLAGRSNAHLVQASIFQLPFRAAAFDGAYCIGVIQHTPDPLQALRAVARALKPGGRLAITIYERRRFTMLYSKYWLRPLTKRLRQEQLLTLIKWSMPPLFALSEVLFRLPVVGRLFKFLIPVANYVDDPELSLKQRYQWALLDTFDMLAPVYDMPQRERDVVHALHDEGVEDVIRLPNPGLNVIGTKGVPPCQT